MDEETRKSFDEQQKYYIDTINYYMNLADKEKDKTFFWFILCLFELGILLNTIFIFIS